MVILDHVKFERLILYLEIYFMKKFLSLTIALIMAVTGIFTTAQIAEASEICVEPVSGVKARLYSSNQVTVSWSRNKDADGYQIYEKSGDNYRHIKTISSNKTTSYRVKKVSKGRNHTYAVRAFENVDGERYYSEFNQSTLSVPKVLKRSTKGFSNTTAGKLIKKAKSKVGSRYVRGGSGPRKFDCSGFVYYVAKSTKVSTKKVPRTSAAGLWKNLKKYSIGTKSLAKAQPGDIVFTASMGGRRITHTAFYYGDGKYVHATNPRKGVRVTGTKYYGKVMGIVRLPNL